MQPLQTLQYVIVHSYCDQPADYRLTAAAPKQATCRHLVRGCAHRVRQVRVRCTRTMETMSIEQQNTKLNPATLGHNNCKHHLNVIGMP